MATALPTLIQSLLRSLQQGDADDRTRTVLHETHGAWVLLGGTHAYKIKKPVKLPFMDFSTLALRRAACQAELTVNRRFEPLAPHPALYIDVLPIVGTPESPQWGQPGTDDPAAIEYAVRMRRFDDTLTLDHLCTHPHGHSSSPSHADMVATGPTLTARHLTAFAADLARIQRHAAVAAADGPYGQAADVLSQALANVHALQTQNLPTARQSELTWLANWTTQQHQRLAPLMVQRLKAGRVREGHGDLHLGNLALIDGAVQAFDAIEFNDQFRWTDVASDMAFTWMDLQHHGQPGLASVFLSTWLDASGDADATDLLPFYGAYRALVRAKVSGIRLAQLAADAKGQAAQSNTAPLTLQAAKTCLTDLQPHLCMALQLAQPAAPVLVIAHGLSGSGKTWASERWLASDVSGRAIRLRSDIERQRMSAAPLQAGNTTQTNRYTPVARGGVYRHMAQRAAHLLQNGWRVLVDATFLHAAQRDAMAEVARQAGVPFFILACEAPADTLRDRILQRQQTGTDASEATLDVLAQQLAVVEPLTPAERAVCLPLPG
ncbi:MAG: AAA family ATPase [Burkholderiales bacterium]|nr:AAA family ATPase [Burkholderiales bacterium]